MEDTKELKVKAWLLNKSTRDKAIEVKYFIKTTEKSLII
jgi:hypothetical protein